MADRSHFILPVLAAGFALAACSPDGDGGTASQGAGEGAAATAEAASDALAAFGLAEPGRVTWESREQDGATFTFTGVQIADEEAGLTAARLVLASPRLTEDGPVFARFELSDARITEAEGDLQAGFDRLLIVDAGPEIAEAVAAVLQGREAFFDAADPRIGRFGEVRIEALSMTGTSETGQPLSFALASAGAAGSDGETVETLAIESLSFATADENNAPITLSLGSMSAQGVAVALTGLAGGDTAGAPMAGAISPTPQYDRFDISELNVLAAGMRVAMPSMTGENEEGRGGRILSRAAMERMSLTADPDGGPQAAQLAGALEQLGYETLNFSFRSEGIYDPQTDRAETTGDNYLRLEDGFTLRIQQAASGINAYSEAYAAWMADSGEASETPPAEVFDPLMIESMAIILEDQSLLDRSLGMMARMQGATPEQLRAQAGGYVAMASVFAGELVPPQLLSELQVALTGFIAQGGTLTVELAPDTPVSMGQLIENGADVDTAALGLSVAHQAP